MEKIAFFDLDNTLYNGYSLYDFFQSLCQQQYFDSSTCQQFHRLTQPYYQGRGDRLKISGQVLDLFAQNIKGRPVEELEKQAEQFWQEAAANLIPPTAQEYERLRKDGYQVAIITGAPEPLAKYFCRCQKLNLCRASQFEQKAGVLTGNFTRNSSYQAKAQSAKDFLKQGSCTLKDSWGFGDEPGDYGFLDLVANPILVVDRKTHQKLPPRQKGI